MTESEFYDKVSTLGDHAVWGATALANLGLLGMRAVAEEVIKADKATARRIYAIYSKVPEEQVANTDVSKLLQLLLLGEDDEGPNACDRAVRFHAQQRKGTLKPLYTALVSVARLQLARVDPVPDEAIKAALAKPGSKPKAKPAPKIAGTIIDIKALIAAKDTGAMIAKRAELMAAVKELDDAITQNGVTAIQVGDRQAA